MRVFFGGLESHPQLAHIASRSAETRVDELVGHGRSDALLLSHGMTSDVGSVISSGGDDISLD